MDNQSSGLKRYQLGFYGKGSELFGIIIVNWLLTILTLGFYYPWAKARQLSYIYGSTSFENDRFTFHGTGKEMFIGYIKLLGIIVVLFGVFGILLSMKLVGLGILLLYLTLFALMPLAIHGAYRYRMSRTTWRGIRFGYRGDRKELIVNFLKWIFFTIITLGIYSAWFAVNLRNYVIGKIRFGDVEFKSKAEGSDYFIIILKGYFLTIITLGIYIFWWQKEMFEFYVNNVSMQKGDQKVKLMSKATGGGFFKLMMGNLLIVVFTLGLGYAWAVTRTMTFVAENIEMTGDIDVDAIQQTEDNYKDATGEDMTDFFDIDFII